MFDIETTVAQLRSAGSDTYNVEAKRASGGVPQRLPETLCAFGNIPGGGVIVLGLDESANFTPVAIDVAMLKKSVASIARQSIAPPLTVEFEDVTFESCDLLVVHVNELATSAKPCFVTRSGKAYLRSWDGDFELAELEVQALLVNRNQPRFDEAPVDGATVSDLSPTLMADYLSLARATDRRLNRFDDDTELLYRTGVVTRSGMPTLAGLLALGEYPQEWFPNFVIQAATAPATGAAANVRFDDIARFSGAIPVMINDAMDWVARHTAHRIIDGPDGRVRDQFDFPPTAVRELLSNALVHRDLAEWARSRTTELRIDGNELRLVNPGGLFGVTVSRLFECQLTSARNALLTRICQFVRLRDGRVVEALASGMAAILTSTSGDGLPAPRFFDQAVSFTAILTRPKPALEPPQPPTRRGARDSSAVARGLPTPTQRLVYEAIAGRAVSVDELTALLKMSEPAVRKHLRGLVDLGLIVIDGGRGKKNTTYRRSTSR